MPYSETTVGAKPTVRRILAQKIIEFHDALLREATADNERFLRQFKAHAKNVPPQVSGEHNRGGQS
jgi:hypothetical protein